MLLSGCPGLLTIFILCLKVCSGALSPCLSPCLVSVTSQHSNQWSFKNKSQIKLLLSLKLCRGSFSSVCKSLWRLGNLQLPTPSAFWLLHCLLHPPSLFHKLWSLCCSSNIPNTLTRQGLCMGCHPCLTHSIHKNLSNSFNIFKSNVKCHLFNEAHSNLLKKKKNNNTVCSLFSKTCYQSTIYPT